MIRRVGILAELVLKGCGDERRRATRGGPKPGPPLNGLSTWVTWQDAIVVFKEDPRPWVGASTANVYRSFKRLEFGYRTSSERVRRTGDVGSSELPPALAFPLRGCVDGIEQCARRRIDAPRSRRCVTEWAIDGGNIRFECYLTIASQSCLAPLPLRPELWTGEADGSWNGRKPVRVCTTAWPRVVIRYAVEVNVRIETATEWFFRTEYERARGVDTE